MSADTVSSREFTRAASSIVKGAGPRSFSDIAAGLAANGYPTERGRRRQGSVHRTGRPVLRDSLEEGTFEEGLFFRPYSNEETWQSLRHLEGLRAHKKKLRRELRADPGRKPSALERLILRITDSTVSTYRVICRLAHATGKVFISLDGLAEDGDSRTQASKAIGLLGELGFMIKQRRFKRVPREGEKDAYLQTSNVYRPTIAKGFLGFLPRWMRPPPLPVCEEQREIDRCDENGRMFAQITCRELARVTFASGPLADVFASLGKARDEAEERVRIPYATSS